MTLLILHERINDVNNNIFGTGFATFYTALTEVPFFGDYYNYILPFLILVVGVLTLLKFHTKMKKITRGIKNKTRDKDESQQNLDRSLMNKKNKDKENEEITEKNLIRGQELIIKHIKKKNKLEKKRLAEEERIRKHEEYKAERMRDELEYQSKRRGSP
mmetsp:Transcript_21641/g.21294  ORF Transcript_21641/g.21294 Transcript_21641/m.21294 type:complete len:159 (+) Transcript_21641:1542-2018(+)